MKGKRRTYRRLMLGAGLLTAILAAVSTIAGLKARQTDVATAVHCGKNGEVAAAIGNRVHRQDARGNSLPRIDRGADGEEFGSIGTVAIDNEGRVWVGDVIRERLHRFGADGKPLGVVEGAWILGSGAFQIFPGPGSTMVLAATIGRRVVSLDSSGNVLGRSEYVGFPNGVALRADGNLLVAETGKAKIAVLDSGLRRVSTPTITQPPYNYAPAQQLFDVALGSDNTFYVSHCRDTSGDCDVLRVPKVGDPELVGTLSSVLHPSYDFEEDIWMLGNLNVLPDGGVLVASNRLGGVFVFEGAEGGRPGKIDGSPRSVSLSDLEGGRSASLGENTRLRRFGNAAFLQAMSDASSERSRLVDVATYARMGLFVMFGLLLATFALFRSAGISHEVDAGSGPVGVERIRRFVRELVLFNLSAPLVYAGAVIAAAGLSGLLVLKVVGPSVALATAVIAGFFVSKSIGMRWFLRHRSWQHAQKAATLYCGPQGWAARVIDGDDAIEFAGYVVPKEEGGTVDDQWEDMLDILFPQLSLLVVTRFKIIVFPCSVFGTPLDRIAVVDRGMGNGEAMYDGRSISIDPEGSHQPLSFDFGRTAPKGAGYEQRWMLGRGRLFCPECGRPVGRSRAEGCVHDRDNPARARRLSMVLPGLGHLALREYRRGRTLMLVAAGHAAETFVWYWYWASAVLVVPALQILWPAMWFVVVWLAAAADVRRLIFRRQLWRRVFQPRAPGIDAFVADMAVRNANRELVLEDLKHINVMAEVYPDNPPATWDADLIEHHLYHMRSLGLSEAQLDNKRSALLRFISVVRR